jgi:iron complex transport system substrate-binding protein
MSDPRIVSLIPSATEIVAALGLGSYLVGRSHECDYPSGVQTLPICTRPNLDPRGSARQIHDQVTALLQSALSIYAVETEQLRELHPTHIITQAQCEVCAVSLADVQAVVNEWIPSQPQILSLEPRQLEDVWGDMARVGNLLQVPAQELITGLQARVRNCQEKVREKQKPSVVCLEWTDPLMAAGNWIPELVEMAGGVDLLGRPGQHSPWVEWDALLAADPERIIVMPCGFNLAKTREAVAELATHSGWPHLQAVQSGEIYIADGNQYFNRPGPRLVDSLEILVEILHPGTRKPDFRGRGWEPLPTLVPS